MHFIVIGPISSVGGSQFLPLKINFLCDQQPIPYAFVERGRYKEINFRDAVRVKLSAYVSIHLRSYDRSGLNALTNLIH